MSEIAPNICPDYCRKLPELAANDLVNDVFRKTLRTSISEEKSRCFASRDEYIKAVAENFYLKLGTGSVLTTIEEIAEGFPEQYAVHTARCETALKYVRRVEGRSYAHTAVLSALIALDGKDVSGRYYVGTDKLGHLVQQGHDYWVIYKIVEACQKGLGELYAQAWGLWTEGEVISEAAISEYLHARNMPSGKKRAAELKKEIVAFIEDSETIEWMGMTPEFAKDIMPLRKLAHLIGTHQLGILGLSSTGIVSYADAAANMAGLRFFLDLEKDPEYLAEHFDIADYVTAEWDEEILKSNYSPAIEQKIKEALKGTRDSYFVYGIGLGFDFSGDRLSLSMPVFYDPFANFEYRVRVGAAAPLTLETGELRGETQIFSAIDFGLRLSGLHYAWISASAGATSQVFSDKALDGARLHLGGGYEIMLLGNTSFYIGGGIDALNGNPSIDAGMVLLRR